MGCCSAKSNKEKRETILRSSEIEKLENHEEFVEKRLEE
jgi:hypothetical protein